MITIYCATNAQNGKKYVGQTSQKLMRRIKAHYADSLAGRSKTYFSRAIVKYGPDVWEWSVLGECDSSADADLLEAHWIEALDSRYTSGCGYNICHGGRTRRGYNHSPETLEKFKGRPSWNKGTKGVTKAWNKGQTGWVVSDPARQVELREQVSNQMRGNRHAAGNTNQRKAVICIDTGEIYPSAYHASEAIRDIFGRSQISAACSGQRKTAYGYRWKFVEGEGHVGHQA